MDSNTTNDQHLARFIQEVHVGESTKIEYVSKLRKLAKTVEFGGTESALVEHLSTVENPNTRSNKAFALIRLRRHFDLPTEKMESARDDYKKEIAHHRKKKAKADMESLMSYDELLSELDKLSGRNFVMNYMWVRHGLRNKDINAVFKSRKPEKVTENTIVFNPSAKKPKVSYHMVDYKAAGTCGDKAIVITDRRFFDEVRGLGLKNNQYMHATQNGTKATVNYMNVCASKHSIRQYGETKIAKILVRHLIESKQYDRISQLSAQRGTSMSTLMSSYNVFDNK